MAERTWNTRLLENTRGQIIHMLRRSDATIGDMAKALGLTDNAVRVHIANLERDGLVQQAGQRRGIRRPEYVYALTTEAEHLFPKAYGLLLAHFLDVLSEKIGPEHSDDVVLEVGRRVVAGLPAPAPGTSREERLQHAIGVIEALGGLAEPRRDNGAWTIEGHKCPLGQVTDGHPEVCRMAEFILSEITGLPIREVCDRSGAHARCVFEVMNGHEANGSA
ncbi:MAG TPA: ArsR family transcriptional regulator [Rhodothermales bacterium]|nr:ArsR family transcriptional regulator [Rhodothermales bacterium]